jgi:hypothetical protein
MRAQENSNGAGNGRESREGATVCAVPGEPRAQPQAICVRLFDPARDRVAVRELAGQESGIEEEKDSLIVAELEGQVCGVLALRMMPLVHDFNVTPGPIARRIADALLNYAKGYVRASAPIEAVVLVAGDNETMQRWLREHGAIEEDPGRFFLLEVR